MNISVFCDRLFRFLTFINHLNVQNFSSLICWKNKQDKDMYSVAFLKISEGSEQNTSELINNGGKFEFRVLNISKHI